MESERCEIDPGFLCNSTQTANKVLFFLILGIAFLLSIFTLAFILAHKRLRQQRFIFQFNIILADLISIVAYLAAVTINWNFTNPEFIRVFLVTPLIVSVINILFVTVYQLITVRIDPFGVRNIITTPRCVIACISSWIVCGVVLYTIDYFALSAGTHTELALVIFTTLAFILTGICLGLIYGVVARTPCENIQMEERKEDNKRVLRTFTFVYGTSLIAAIMTCTSSIKLHVSKRSFGNQLESDECLVFVVTLVTGLNWIANSVVYLWRLKEFRSIAFSCRENNRVDIVN